MCICWHWSECGSSWGYSHGGRASVCVHECVLPNQIQRNREQILHVTSKNNGNKNLRHPRAWVVIALGAPVPRVRGWCASWESNLRHLTMWPSQVVHPRHPTINTGFWVMAQFSPLLITTSKVPTSPPQHPSTRLPLQWLVTRVTWTHSGGNRFPKCYILLPGF